MVGKTGMVAVVRTESCSMGLRALPGIRSGDPRRSQSTIILRLAPYLAYSDIGHRCSDCGEKFVFTKHEQRFWYEELGFWVQSRPKQCVACRQKRRTTAEANTRLQQAIAELDPQNSEQRNAFREAIAKIESQSPDE